MKKLINGSANKGKGKPGKRTRRLPTIPGLLPDATSFSLKHAISINAGAPASVYGAIDLSDDLHSNTSLESSVLTLYDRYRLVGVTVEFDSLQGYPTDSSSDRVGAWCYDIPSTFPYTTAAVPDFITRKEHRYFNAAKAAKVSHFIPVVSILGSMGMYGGDYSLGTTSNYGRICYRFLGEANKDIGLLTLIYHVIVDSKRMPS